MSSSTPAIRFLLDENVRADIGLALRKDGFTVLQLAKGASDADLAQQSREEQLVILTNDLDFASMPTEKIYSVVLLRMPQHDAEAQYRAIRRLSAKCATWEGKVIVLEATRWRTLPLKGSQVKRPRAA